MGSDGTPSNDMVMVMVKYITLVRNTGSSLYLTTSVCHFLQLLRLTHEHFTQCTMGI